MNKFYVYMVGDKYVHLTGTLRKSLKKTIDKASYWRDLRQCKSWALSIKKKYPTCVIKECGLVLKYPTYNKENIKI